MVVREFFDLQVLQMYELDLLSKLPGDLLNVDCMYEVFHEYYVFSVWFSNMQNYKLQRAFRQ